MKRKSEPRPLRLSFYQRFLGLSLIVLVASGVVLADRLDGLMEGFALSEVESRAQLIADSALAQLPLPSHGELEEKHVAEIESILKPNAAMVMFTVWSPEGRVLYSTNEKRMGKVYPLGRGVRDAFDSRTNSHFVRPKGRVAKGHELLFETYVPIRAQPGNEVIGVFAVYQAATHLEGATLAMKRATYVVVAVVVGVLLAALYLLARLNLTRPLRRTVRQAEGYAGGDLTPHSEEQGDDFGRLTRALNFMASRLDARQQELNHKNEELEEANERLTTANRVKTEFLGTISHELRTPVTGITGYSDLMLDGSVGPINEAQTDYLREILTAGKQLMRIVDNLLDLSRLEAGWVKPEPEPCPAVILVEPVMKAHEREAAAKGLGLKLELDADVPIAAADPRLTRQILNHLISNALKFTEEGEITVKVERQGELVCFQVLDTGVGVPLDAQAYIWEDFRQADGSKTRRFSGAGMGLPMVRRLVRLQGGTVDMHSVQGQGSTFSFTLPAWSVHANAA